MGCAARAMLVNLIEGRVKKIHERWVRMSGLVRGQRCYQTQSWKVKGRKELPEPGRVETMAFDKSCRKESRKYSEFTL